MIKKIQLFCIIILISGVCFAAQESKSDELIPKNAFIDLLDSHVTVYENLDLKNKVFSTSNIPNNINKSHCLEFFMIKNKDKDLNDLKECCRVKKIVEKIKNHPDEKYIKNRCKDFINGSDFCNAYFLYYEADFIDKIMKHKNYHPYKLQIQSVKNRSIVYEETIKNQNNEIVSHNERKTCKETLLGKIICAKLNNLINYQKLKNKKNRVIPLNEKARIDLYNFENDYKPNSHVMYQNNEPVIGLISDYPSIKTCDVYNRFILKKHEDLPQLGTGVEIFSTINSPFDALNDHFVDKDQSTFSRLLFGKASRRDQSTYEDRIK